MSRQVLADPAMLGPDVHVWARLQDGTPLVTSANSARARSYSSTSPPTPIGPTCRCPGLFVEMLRRISALGSGAADGGGTGTANEAGAPDAPSVLPPLQTLDGFGILAPPPPTAQPVNAAKVRDLVPSLDHPPGYYGAGGSPHAVNVLGPKSTIVPLPALPAGTERLNYESESAHPLKSWLLLGALALLFADILAVILLQAGGFGLWRRTRRGTAHAALALAVDWRRRPVDRRAWCPGAAGRSDNADADAGRHQHAGRRRAGHRSDEQGHHRLRADRRPERR